MIAAIATVVFLAAAWAAIVSLAALLESNLGRVGAALLGETPALLTQSTAVRLSPRYPQARSQRVRARPALRVAA